MEERGASEVATFAGRRVTPATVAVANPAFDVTPAELVTTLITESGTVSAPYPNSLARLAEGS